jgi:hypothetical protein
MLNDDKHKDRIKIKELVPEFKTLGRNDRPAIMLMCEIGEIERWMGRHTLLLPPDVFARSV